jgi:hypothetical protein
VISQFGSKFGAVAAALAVLGSISSTAIPTAAMASPAPAVAVADTTQNSDCGTIAFGASTPDATAIRSAENCLQSAFSSCREVQLAVTWDTATERVDRLLTVDQPDNGNCRIVDQVTRTAKSSGVDSSNIYMCGGLTADTNGLTLRKCGEDGDILVPSAQ